jgi:hypothetical protein
MRTRTQINFHRGLIVNNSDFNVNSIYILKLPSMYF